MLMLIAVQLLRDELVLALISTLICVRALPGSGLFEIEPPPNVVGDTRQC